MSRSKSSLMKTKSSEGAENHASHATMVITEWKNPLLGSREFAEKYATRLAESRASRSRGKK